MNTKLALRARVIAWAKVIFTHTLGRWSAAYGYARRFYAFIRVVDPPFRRKILIAHGFSTLTNMIFLIGSLAIIPFVNYVIVPDSVNSNQWLNRFYLLVTEHTDLNFTVVLGLSSVFILILARVFFVVGSYITQRIHIDLRIYYTTKLYYSYIHQQAHSSEASTSEIVNNISVRLPAVIGNFVNPVFSIINIMFYLGTGLVILYLLDPRLVLLSILGTLCFLGGSIFATQKRMRRYSVVSDSGNLEKHRRLLNSIGAREYIQMTGKANLFAKSFAQIQRVVSIAGLRINMIATIFNPLSEIIIYFTMVLVSFYIILISGREHIQFATAFLIILYRLLPQVNNLFTQYLALKQGVVSYDAVSAQLLRALKMQVSYEAHVKNPLPFKKSVAVRNASFSYPQQAKGELALDKINLTIRRGMRLGVCGVSGGGKTTLLRLITARIQPTRGTLKVDGRIIKDRRLVRRWQDAIGYVTQNLILIEGTLAENIALLSADEEQLDDAALQRAIDMAELRALVNKLPQREHSQVSDAGANISGGQRQRIIIARALYHNPDLLIFDEATSSLDKKTESKILSNIYQHWKDDSKTIIFVTHRLDSIKQCDSIVMVQDGKIAAQGTYKELMKRRDFRQLATAKT